MCPCDPNSLNVTIPDSPTGPNIPGFGQPFTPKIPTKDLDIPSPEDLVDLMKKFRFKLPFGELKSPLNPNYGKDAFDQIIKLFDMFMPFLMLYKFFLPVLKLILCILEVICAMPNPVKVGIALQKLFRDCIPLFLALFPIIAIIIMIIALLVLLVQIIIYMILLIVNFIKLIIKNIKVLYDAFSIKNENSILAAVNKLGRILCLIQNLFVIFVMVDIIIQVFKDILNSVFSIPPCDDSGGCCSPDVCPKFIKNGDFTRVTGEMYYTSALNLSMIGSSVREQTFQLLDPSSLSSPESPEKAGVYVKQPLESVSNPWIYQQFINIINPNDPGYAELASKYFEKFESYPVFFPTDNSYNSKSSPGQCPYLVDMEFYYDPAKFGRFGKEHGEARIVKFKNCIVTKQSEDALVYADGSTKEAPSGVITISGGKGYESDDSTPLKGYKTAVDNNTTLTNNQATLENFLFLTSKDVLNPLDLTNVEGSDFVSITDIKYTFKINHQVLVTKNIITYSCMPDVNQDRAFTNATVSADLNEKLAQLTDFPFPDANAAQECMLLAMDAFRNDVTEQGAKDLEARMLACLNNLQQDTENAINIAIPLAFDKFKSSFTLLPKTQFTTDKILVRVDLKESSGTSLINLLPAGSADYVLDKLKANVTLGSISKFKYDGDQYFEAELSSQAAGDGEIEISFDNKKISDISPSNTTEDLTKPLSISIRKLPYTFIFAQSIGAVSVGTGDSSEGVSPRRDEGDVSNQAS